MWAHDIDTAEYAGIGSTAIEARVPGSTSVDDEVVDTEGRRDRPRHVILGIETSCDETAAAVVVGGTDVLSSVVSSQVDLHARFGGVVPEIASRAHVELLTPVIAQAFVEAGIEDVDDRRGGGDRRPGPRRLAARRGERGEGAGAGVGRAVRRR